MPSSLGHFLHLDAEVGEHLLGGLELRLQVVDHRLGVVLDRGPGAHTVAHGQGLVGLLGELVGLLEHVQDLLPLSHTGRRDAATVVGFRQRVGDVVGHHVLHLAGHHELELAEHAVDHRLVGFRQLRQMAVLGCRERFAHDGWETALRETDGRACDIVREGLHRDAMHLELADEGAGAVERDAQTDEPLQRGDRLLREAEAHDLEVQLLCLENSERYFPHGKLGVFV